MMRKKRFLVTGAAGFVGSHTVELLLNNGYDVVGIDNFSTGCLENLKRARQSKHFTWLICDATRQSALQRIFDAYSFDGVLHLAALVSVQQSFDLAKNYQQNIAMTDLVGRLALQNKCPRLVFASSSAVYGNSYVTEYKEPDSNHLFPISPYGLGKKVSEQLLLSYSKIFDLSVICLRYFNVYGPRQKDDSEYSGVVSKFVRKYINNEDITIYGSGEQTRNFVHVFDVARANVTALTAPKETPDDVYNVCSDQEITISQLVEILDEKFHRTTFPVYQDERVGDIKFSNGTNAKIRDRLGFMPAISFNDGIADLIEYCS